MDIYFDFEATQFSDQIIAIGATCKNGNYFNLVSSFANKLTPFITDLTGITKEMLAGAPSADEAFEALHSWIGNMTTYEPTFYHCYGDCDKVFLHRTAEKIQNASIAEFVNNLADSLIDDSKTVCRYFHAKAVGVFKGLKYFEPDYPDQKHNPLEDAIALSCLMEHVRTAPALTEYPFAPEGEKKIVIPKSKSGYLITATSLDIADMKPKFFETYGQAADWLVARIQKKNPTAKRENILKRMKNAIDSDGEYAHFDWSKNIIRNDEERN